MYCGTGVRPVLQGGFCQSRGILLCSSVTLLQMPRNAFVLAFDQVAMDLKNASFTLEITSFCAGSGVGVTRLSGRGRSP